MPHSGVFVSDLSATKTRSHLLKLKGVQMSAVEQFLSTEAAQAFFKAAYALPAAAAVGGAQKYANSDHLYAELGKRDKLTQAEWLAQRALFVWG